MGDPNFLKLALRRVRTPEGARLFDQPIGTVIKPDVIPNVVQKVSAVPDLIPRKSVKRAEKPISGRYVIRYMGRDVEVDIADDGSSIIRRNGVEVGRQNPEDSARSWEKQNRDEIVSFEPLEPLPLEVEVPDTARTYLESKGINILDDTKLSPKFDSEHLEILRQSYDQIAADFDLSNLSFVTVAEAETRLERGIKIPSTYGVTFPPGIISDSEKAGFLFPAQEAMELTDENVGKSRKDFRYGIAFTPGLFDDPDDHTEWGISSAADMNNIAHFSTKYPIQWEDSRHRQDRASRKKVLDWQRRHVALHEMAHVVTNRLIYGDVYFTDDAFLKMHDLGLGTPTFGGIKLNAQKLQKDLGVYAASNFQELLAEIVTAHYMQDVSEKKMVPWVKEMMTFILERNAALKSGNSNVSLPLVAAIKSGRPRAMNREELDGFLQRIFPDAPVLEAPEKKHPKSGWTVKYGHGRRLYGLPESERDSLPQGPLGYEIPAELEIHDYGDFDETGKSVGRMFGSTPIGKEPLKYVYRGMSLEEWAQAQERGYIESDRRGAIHDSEGTNAGLDPRTAASYLPNRNGMIQSKDGAGVIVQIAVKPEHEWFKIQVDDYPRSREQIPLADITTVSPVIYKDETGSFYTEPPAPKVDEAALVTSVLGIDEPWAEAVRRYSYQADSIADGRKDDDLESFPPAIQQAIAYIKRFASGDVLMTSMIKDFTPEQTAYMESLEWVVLDRETGLAVNVPMNIQQPLGVNPATIERLTKLCKAMGLR